MIKATKLLVFWISNTLNIFVLMFLNSFCFFLKVLL